MKKEMFRLITSSILVSLMALTGVYANGQTTSVITISKAREDITGDGKEEKIYLKGEPYGKENPYFKKIYIETVASNNKTYLFSLEGGSKASIQLVDLNHDNVKDLYASVLTSGSSGIIHSYLFSLKDFSKKKIPVPEPLEAETQFMNNYKANIILKDTAKSYEFDLNDRKDYYKKLGLYHNGKLNEPTELTVNPYSTLKPALVKGNETGLIGIQRVTGIANADTIGYIQSSWLYEGGRWKLIQADVLKEAPNE
jgi:hypothetical protein